MTDTPDKTHDDPSTPSAAVTSMAEHWPLIDALMGGTSAMRKAGVRHLPRWPSEDLDAYECRRATAVLFPAYSRTVSILTGKPFSKPITVGEDVPERIRGWLEDVDREGRNLDAFAAAVFADALAYGISGVLVDAPPSPGARTVKEEAEAGIRPYFVHVKHDDILGWRSEARGGATRLTQLRLMESVEEPVGRFGTKVVKQVRVLEPGRWEVWRKVEGADGRESWRVHDEGATTVNGAPLGEIPFVPVYGYRKEFMVGVPPMLDLAHLNVEHWQGKSDQQTILHTARVPILLGRKLGKKEDIAIGAGTLILSDDPEADMKFVEHTGSAIDAGRAAILDLEDQMRQVGAELLVIKPGNTTEVQTRSDNEPAMCDLQRISLSLQDALRLAIYHMARFAGEESGGGVTIYNDFGVQTQSDASAQLVVGMQADGALSHATALNELKRRGVLAADVDVDAEVAAAKAERAEASAMADARERAMIAAATADVPNVPRAFDDDDGDDDERDD